MNADDSLLDAILRRTRVIACIGVSADPVRPSHYVARYLHQRGYRVIPVNPQIAGTSLFGEEVRAGLAEIPPDAAVDMVDIFRRPDHVPAIVAEALEILPALATVWMQIGVTHADAAAAARARGVTVIQNRCPKIEYQRLYGELRRAGFNTGRISSRLPPLPPR